MRKRWQENLRQLEFQISAEYMELLKNFKKIKSYGDSGIFPAYGGKM